MSPQDYCTARIVGRPGYYATLFAPAEARAALQALFAIHAELETIPAECSDPAVARAKYQWWLEDLAHTRSGRPQHPALRALEVSPTGRHVPSALLATLLEALAAPLTMTLRGPDAGVVHDWRTPGGTFGRLLAFASGEHRAAALQAAEDIGAQFRSSETSLSGHAGQAPMISTPEPARMALGHALHAAYGLKTPTLTPHLVLAEVRVAQLRRLARTRSGAPVARAELHPLEMLWIAWRTARRVA